MVPTTHPWLPDWLPVLVGATGGIQVGLDPGVGLLIDGAPAELADLLRLLDGAHSLDELLAEAAERQLDSDLVHDVLRSLEGAGLLHAEGRRMRLPAALSRVRLVGAGVLGSAVAHALMDAGVAELHLVDDGSVDPRRLPRRDVRHSPVQRLAAELGHRTGEVRVAEHWSDADPLAPAVTVVATDRIEPDRAIGLEYVRAGHPHLYLRPLLGGAVIGPYVRPGAAPCLACMDLIRTDADPDWPALLPQLCSTTATVDPLLARWAAATAITQLIQELDHQSGVLAGTLEMTSLTSEPRHRSWPVHPDCHCLY